MFNLKRKIIMIALAIFLALVFDGVKYNCGDGKGLFK